MSASYVRPLNGPFTIRKASAYRPPVAHCSLSAAQAEAERLLGRDPDATFIISQEVASVKRREAA